MLETPHPPVPPADPWPPLPLDDWRETRDTLHLWTQIVGKVRLALSPHINHWWQATLYVTPRGLSTGPIPAGHRSFRIDFDFLDDRLDIQVSDGATRHLVLALRSVADFHAELMSSLRALGLDVTIWTMPVEIENAVRFEQDHAHAAYSAEHVRRFWTILVQADRLLGAFRSRFIGKCSPVHFFWGSFDLAVTRFSGRRAPLHGPVPNTADSVVREAYSHEVSSAGFWPGGGTMSSPIFYAYAYPEPAGFSQATVRPDAAAYSVDWGEFLLPYDVVRQAPDPDAMVLDFLQTTYDAAAECGRWDRAALERPTS